VGAGWPLVQNVQLQGSYQLACGVNAEDILDDGFLVGFLDGDDLPEDLLAAIVLGDNVACSSDFLRLKRCQGMDEGHWRDVVSCAQYGGHCGVIIITVCPRAGIANSDVV
jgi:hypothetical protein